MSFFKRDSLPLASPDTAYRSTLRTVLSLEA
jgi:hypothetical protein